MTEWKADVCIYHFPCDDGFASAWVARRKWPDIVLAPTNYGLKLPEVEIDGKNFTLALLASDDGSGEVTLADLMRFTELDEVRLRSAVTTLDNWEIISANFDGANNLVFRMPPA